MRIDFARLNHILVPGTKDERDRLRNGAIGRLVMPVVDVLGSLTDEGLLVAVITAISLAASIDVLRTNGYALGSILVGLLMGSLVASRRLRPDGLSVSVNAPRRVTIGEDVTFNVTCRFEPKDEDADRNRAPLQLLLRGPFLPWDGTWIGKATPELALAPGSQGNVTMRATFIARGPHQLDPFTVALLAPLGLACGPRRRSPGVTVIVVPNVANVVRLPLALATKHQPGGVALASKAGESMELLGVRPYRRGDPVRDLHARTWARTGVPSVREYQQEYFTRVGVVLDTSTTDEDALEEAIELAAGVVRFICHGEALIDMLVVGDSIHELTLGRSLGRFDQALELLATVGVGPPLDASRLVHRLAPHLEQLSAVFVIAPDKGDPAEQDRLAERLRARGLACTVLRIDEKVSHAIRTREPIAW
jgi:uncharacterized protein (DUF58 family)